MKSIYRLMVSAGLVLLSASCVKDTLYDTPHPLHGKISVTADWSGRGEGIEIPAIWNVAMGEYTGSETGPVHAPDYRFAPGTYTLVTWNPAEMITVDGSRVTASYSHGLIGWLFTCTRQATIAADRDHSFTAGMKQQVRRLTIVIETEGDASQRISGVEATLGGIDSSLDAATDSHSGPVNVALDFGKTRDGNKWAATVRLLGTAGTMQRLSGSVNFAGGNPRPVAFESNLSADLADFNADKRSPLTLYGKLVATPGQTGVTATIQNWEILDHWNVDAY